MTIGLDVSKEDLNLMAGSIARDIRLQLRRAADLHAWLSAKTDPELTALGYTSGEIASVRSAFTDADRLNQIYVGAEAAPAAYDFRTFQSRLWGLGIG